MSKRKSINAMISIESRCKVNLVRRKARLMAKLEPDGIKTSNLGDDLDASCIHGYQSKSFIDILPEIMGIQAEINDCDKEIEVLKRLKEQIFENINEIDDINNQVKYLRDYIGLSLSEIAEILGYSYDRIKHISAKSSTKNDTDILKKA